jgi:hypothetical protein
MVPGEKGATITQELLKGKHFVIPNMFRAEYKSKKVAFWRQEGLPPERILLNIGHHIEDKISSEDRQKFVELDVTALNFFLCQTHILGYEEIISKIFTNKDHITTWESWIRKYISVLMEHNSQTSKVL